VASTLTIYAKVAGSRLRSQFSYRLSFVLQILGASLLSSLDFVVILVIFVHLPRLAGWSLPEIAFLYGTSYVPFRFGDMTMGNLDRLPLFIRMGSFDQVMTRPLGTLMQVLTSEIDIRHVGGMAQGAVVLAYAFRHVHVHWDAVHIVLLVTMAMSAYVIFASIWVATNAIAFWTMDAREVANSVTYGGNAITQYPMSIYGTWMRRLFGYLVPLAFVNYYPSLFLLGKTDPGHSPSFLRFISPVVAVASAAVAGGIWRLAVRHYRSTGS